MRDLKIYKYSLGDRVDFYLPVEVNGALLNLKINPRDGRVSTHTMNTYWASFIENEETWNLVAIGTVGELLAAFVKLGKEIDKAEEKERER
jgi:hypothetical protein|tara:strand:+ start:3903 stop:4175 length:273 start_codon:yes stop_codon:yes gene_type:complete